MHQQPKKLHFTIVESETCAYEDQWRCQSGECISIDQLCDSSRDCVDGSGRNMIHLFIGKKYIPIPTVACKKTGGLVNLTYKMDIFS